MGKLARDGSEHLMLRIGEEDFCVPASRIIEFRRAADLIALPDVPAWVHGVVRRAERFITVVDLPGMQGAPVVPAAADATIVLLDLDSGPAALLCHESPRILHADAEADGQLGGRRPWVADETDIDRLMRSMTRPLQAQLH